MRLLRLLIFGVLLGGTLLASEPARGAGKSKTFQSYGAAKPKPTPAEDVAETNRRILWVGASVLLVGVAAYLFGANRSRDAEIRAVDHARNDVRRQRPEELNEHLRRIHERDPGFEREVFLSHARSTFLEVRDARAGGDPRPASRLMSDGLLRRFLTEAALEARRGNRTVIGATQVLGCEIVAAESDAGYDVLHVCLSGAARQATVPATTPAADALDRAARGGFVNLDEVWSFVRRLHPGECKGSLVDGKCPSCGAPVARAAVTSCEYCKAILNSGAHDWVLAGVRSAPDFFCRTPGSQPGWRELRRRDGRLHRAVLEDRAALVFWKWVESLVTGTPERFQRLCTPEAFQRLELCGRRMPQGFERIELGDVHFSEAAVEPGRDRAHLLLYWRTARETWELPRKSVLTLERRGAVSSREDTGLATDRCHQCAAPQQELDAVTCSYCGAVLPNDWSFVDCVPIDEFYATRHASGVQADWLAQVVGEAENPLEAYRLVGVMTAMVRADGVVRESERALLLRCAERWDVPQERLSELLAMPVERLSALRPQDGEEAKRVLRGLVAAAYVDGGVGPKERALLSELTGTLHLDPGELDLAVTEVETAVAQARREAAEASVG